MFRSAHRGKLGSEGRGVVSWELKFKQVVHAPLTAPTARPLHHDAGGHCRFV